ncbi:NfeD family protein [Hippea jasoniae]|uniref:NfeD family protein n=1 Tax=Hippea jasoniae TaxID=944479 RepID=UPI000552FEB0|nr:NfeD family protein [Hippea jasoniae]
MITFIEVVIIVSIILVILEFFITTGGIFALTGIFAFIAAYGLALLLKLKMPLLFLKITIPVFIFVSLASLVTVYVALKAQKKKALVGDIVGKTGVCKKDIMPKKAGQVEIDGTLWLAFSKKPIKAGSRVRVIKQDSLKLEVEEVE